MASDPGIRPDGDTLPSGRAAGVTIGVGSILSVALMLHHPTIDSHGTAAFIDELVREATINGVVHGALIALSGILVCGYSCFASRLGMKSLWVRAGLIAYVAGAIAGTAAAIGNGFALPGFAGHYQNRPPADHEAMRHVLTLFGAVMHAIAQLWAVATSVAVLLWSIALLRQPNPVRIVGLFGCLVGALPAVGIVSGHLHLHKHGALAFILAHAVWSLAIAGLLIRNRI